MRDARDILERSLGRFAPQPDGYERVLRRRDRKQRRERIVAGAVALAIGFAVIGAVVYAVPDRQMSRPAESPTEPPTATLPEGVSLLDPNTGTVTPIPGAAFDGRWQLGLDVSPDGATVAFARKVGDLPEIFVMDIDGTGTRQLTFAPFSGGSPAWSPSGDQIAFDSMAGDLFVMNADGSAVRRVTPSNPIGFGMYRGPVWSPDASKLAFWTVGGPHNLIGVFDVRTGETSLLTGDEQSAAYPAWSPDGRWIAYARAGASRAGASGGFEESTIWLMHPDGTSPHLLVEALAADSSPTWSPDGQWIAFSQTDHPANGPSEIAIVDIATGTIRVVARNAADTFDWSPRGDLVVAGFSPGNG